jgi:hypothetical protein
MSVLFVLNPDNEGCWGRRGVRISPIAGREANAGENDGATAGAGNVPLIGGWGWFNWLDGIMGDAVSGCCWLVFAKTSDNEML